MILAPLAADRVARTRATGRYDLFGVFHALNLRLPTRLTFAAYYCLTGGHRAADLDLVFLGPDDDRPARGPVVIPPARGRSTSSSNCGTFEGVPLNHRTYATTDHPGDQVLLRTTVGEVPAAVVDPGKEPAGRTLYLMRPGGGDFLRMLALGSQLRPLIGADAPYLGAGSGCDPGRSSPVAGSVGSGYRRGHVPGYTGAAVL